MQGTVSNACFFTAREKSPTALLAHAALSDALNADNLKWLEKWIHSIIEA